MAASSGNRTAKRSGASTGSRRRTSYSAGRKAVKKMSSGAVVLCLVLLVTGFVLGQTAYNMITAGDCFELVGEQRITVPVGQRYYYADEGIKAVRYGADCSSHAYIETNLEKRGENYTMDTSRPGKYYIIYRVDDKKFENMQKIRVFEVVDEENA